VYKIL